MPQLAEIVEEKIKEVQLMDYDQLAFVVLSSKEKDDENDIDDDINDDEDEGESPYEKEPSDKDIFDNDIPIVDPEDDLIDDDEEIPYN
jgi:hypothetical protein